MGNALAVLSGDDSDSWLHSPIHGERAKAAVGLAWLFGDKVKLNHLIEAKLAFLRNRKDFGLADFEAFIKSLETASQPRRSETGT